jgi:hypothetical protein
MRYRTLATALAAAVIQDVLPLLVREAPAIPNGAAPRRAPAPARIAPWPGRLPPIVFVSRQRAPAGTGLVPGLGPNGRTLATGGKLILRDPKGRLQALVPDGVFFDVSDPCPDWDGERVVFAATVSPDSAWRIWEVGADGNGLRQVTHADRAALPADAGFEPQRFARYDDVDPCWLPDGRVCFASTRFPQRAQQGDLLVTNLFVTRRGAAPRRVTAERNGAEEPAIDPRTGRIVYARWWFNRYLPSDVDPGGTTLDRTRAVPQDTIDQWTSVTITTDGDGLKLAAGDARRRATLRAYQPLVLADGTAVAVWAENASMLPAPGAIGLVSYRGGVGPATPLTGPGTALPGDACAPAGLPGGRILFAWDPDGTGDFGLYAMHGNGTSLARVLDLPGTLEMDPCVLVPRRRPPIAREEFPDPAPPLPPTRAGQLADSINTFRFDCLNVFTNAPVDAAVPDAPMLRPGLRIRFYAVLARPALAGGDSLVLLREVPVDASGAVHADNIPADTPSFEQLVDSQGRVVRSARGPAHVPGFNFARMGGGTKCVGCHPGHSTIEPPLNYWRAKWFNASPSAEVEASSTWLGAPRALVDRRARGPLEEVAWVAGGARDEEVRLSWQTTIEVRAVVLYAPNSTESASPQSRVQETEIAFFRDGREAKRLVVRRALSPAGTRIECEPVRADALLVRPTRVMGRVRGRRAAALAEIETIARLIED